MAESAFPEIERRTAANRNALAQSLDQLSDTLSPERLKQELAETANHYGTDISRQLWDGARKNPAAFSLVAVGIALLLTGSGARGENAAKSSGSVRRPTDTVPDAADGALRPSPPPTANRKARAPAPTAEKLRAALNRGMEKLPPDARIRVLRAREAAIAAQQSVERRAVRASRWSSAMAREQPVAVSATAFGVGALLASLLPSTKTEDELLGEKRDLLMETARATLKEELSKLQDAADSHIQSARYN
ncbi:DUF3619 family protein [Tateyamaria pelophila]|uniref:DUF3619 family protein n=1 Tax=Tateyamaria pelophila TaxID=328415 RepID=UPI001CBCD3E9|nr:DUF3619 family protein [Tateyamaria pelophila]